jgi:hypothetical protein
MAVSFRVKNRFSFLKDDSAVIDLPMYLVITLIIGSVALVSILSMMVLPSMFTGTPLVSVEPLITSINTTNASIQYQVYVSTPDHQPIRDAHIILKNQNTIATNSTNNSGGATITIPVTIPSGLQQIYLDVIVKTASYQTVTNNNMLKVILRR